MHATLWSDRAGQPYDVLVAAPTQSRHDSAAGHVHPTAIVESGVSVGPSSNIWHHAHLRSGSIVGGGCNIGKNVYIDEGVVVGDRVKIQNNVSLYRGVTIGDDVFLGPSCVFTNDRHPRATNDGWAVVLTDVRRGASIGANATIVCGVVIGEWSAVGAGGVVTHDVLDHQLVYGNPAVPAGWVCWCGEVVSRDATTAPATFECGRCDGPGRS
jgi:UDP-2-acetamido-3-amino-2,3-dideoxy-glucuronate N-acetyltransferase